MITLKKETVDYLCGRLPTAFCISPEVVEAEASVLHDVLCDRSKDLRATWSVDSAGQYSKGVFYYVGPSLTKGLTPIQYEELIRLARVGIKAEEGGER